jgi:YVTN family beta-propeller protein
MRFRLPKAAAVAATLAGHLALAGGGVQAAERIYVLSQSAAALSEIADGAEKAVPAVTLDKAPAALALAPDTGLAYVTHPDLGQVSVVDLGAKRVVRTLAVAGSPFGVAVTRDGRLFVGDWNGAHVSVLGVEGDTSLETVEVGRAPAHLLLSPDETLLFVANRESDSVSVVRTGDLSVAATIPVDRAPFAMALSPDAARLYVGNVQAGTVSVIDTGTLKVVETLTSGAMPYGAAVTPDGARVLVTNQQASTVSVLGHGSAPPATIKVGGYPEGVVISADGTRAYVANWFSDDVSVLDLASLKELRRIKCPGGPRGIVATTGPP